jgi:hypothetical protein
VPPESYARKVTDMPDPHAPWGSCPRCGRPLLRDQLPLQTWPATVSMQGPPVCPVCTTDEIERYIAEWEPSAAGDPDTSGPALG